MPHQKARVSPYQGSAFERSPVTDSQVNWGAAFEEYAPRQFTADVVLAGPVWADRDADIGTDRLRFNQLDGPVNRVSHEGEYVVTADGLPQNPRGRTGLTGRGLLGRFGPNHAADPIVSRWRRNAEGEIVTTEGGDPIFEFVGIKRRDNGQWGIPGGMVDPGEEVSLTLKREFGEESLNSLELPPEEAGELKVHLDKLFQNGTHLYAGYCDDPRNTDNAWMETTVVNFHDDDGAIFRKFPLAAGDDAGDVAWVIYRPGMDLFALHTYFIALAKAHNLRALREVRRRASRDGSAMPTKSRLAQLPSSKVADGVDESGEKE